MASRMSRYYKEEEKTNTRTSLNKDLYRTIYQNTEYSNVEGVLTNPKPNEVNINKLRELLQEREDMSAPKPIIREKPEIVLPNTSFEDDNNRNYDIRDILSKAKTDHEEEKYHRMQEYNYTLPDSVKTGSDLVKEADEIKKLMHTLTSTSLKKLSDEELSLDLFDDLKSGNTMSNSKAIRKIIDEEIKKELNDTSKLNNTGLDKSFFTNSLNFGKDDFDDLNEMSETIHKNNKLLTTILLFIATAVVIILIVLIAAQVMK